MYPKIYNEFSKDISALDIGFYPIASHLLSAIDDFCKTNSQYSYEIICTKRTWYGQKKITLIPEDNRNGLSWYLYGKAISINVYKSIKDQIVDANDPSDTIKQYLNFSDKSAITFISAIQEWFNNNLLNGNIVKIFGIYPTIKQNIGISHSILLEKYKNDNYVIYWGGLFKGFSNFSHWEWHPSLAPNEVYKEREIFLNTALSDYDILSNLDSESNIDGPTYLSNEIELVEEDYLSLWNLKCEINHKREYNFFDIIKWAKNNPFSLNQSIIYYKILGEYSKANLFENIKLEIDSISYENNTLASNNFTLSSDSMGNIYYSYYDEFGDKNTLLSTSTITLPCDNMPTKEEFDQIELSIDDSNELLTSTGSTVSVDTINKEILDTSSSYIDNRFEINEHGLLGDLSINTNKLVTDLEDAKKIAMSKTVFEEMIIPPNMSISNKKKGILDISIAIKNNVIGKIDDERIVPPK